MSWCCASYSPVLDGSSAPRHSPRQCADQRKNQVGLLLVGTPEHEPWHLAAHLDDEAQFSGVAELSPTLVRYAPPADAPEHLAFSLQRLEQAKRGETVFVVSDENAPESLLSRGPGTLEKSAPRC